MNTIATFIYEDVCRFLPAWVENVNRQSSDEIAVMVFSDNVKNPGQYFSDLKYPFHVVEVSGSIMQNRIDALAHLRQVETDTIIFQDADDLMSENRVEVSAALLESYDVVVCDLSLIDENGKHVSDKVWSGRLGDGFEFGHPFIRKWNIAGLGNTAIRKELLIEIPVPASPIQVADWYIFYQMMEKSGAKGVFTDRCQTFYRQHDSNLAGINKLSKEKLERAISVKKSHYEALMSAGYDFQNEIDELYKIDTDRPMADANLENPLFWWEETEWYEKN